jgi:PAS domain S-box-containing protein
MERQDTAGTTQCHRSLIEDSRDIIYSYRLGSDRGFEYVNGAATEITGYTPEEHYADPDLGFKLVHPDDRHLLESLAAADTDVSEPLRLRWVRKDGTVIWTEQLNTLVKDANGTPVAIHGVARDVTEAMRRGDRESPSFSDFDDFIKEIRSANGLVVVCASCEKVRGREGGWQPLDLILRERAHVRFSHGLCPDCCAVLEKDL